MLDKTPAAKLLVKADMTLALLNPPTGYPGVLGLPEGVALTSEPQGADAILVFVTTQAEAETVALSLEPHIGTKTIAWIAYPKGSTAAGFDLNRDTIWAFLRTIGLNAVSQVSLDSYWSALRVRR